MSKKLIVPSLLMILSLLLVTGCMRQASLQNLTNMPVAGMTGKSLPSTQVRDAIITAARERHWVAREVKPGLITAALDIRQHTAVVEIPYDGKSYSINYKSSTNLDYNAKDRTIHNQYNNWVDYLRQSIDARLATLE